MDENRTFVQMTVDLFRGEDRKPGIILFSSTCLMVLWRCFGSAEFFVKQFGDRCALYGSPEAAGAVYSFLACFVLLGLIPLLIVKLIFRERLADYGVTLGNRKRTFMAILFIVPFFIVGGYFSSETPSVQKMYPLNPGAASMPIIHALSYLAFYLGWEFHFRGFLQLGLRDRLGAASALWVQVLASTILHIGKPNEELIAAIFAGIFWGILVYRTRSLLAGLAQHFALGISLDWFLSQQ
jgi:membrane protease YdiL (CAAX protease family)